MEERFAVRCMQFSKSVRLSFLFLYLFFLLKPFYLLPSGSFQMGDLCLAASFFSLVVGLRGALRLTKDDLFFFAFVAIACVVNALYYARYAQMEFLLRASYYVFAFMVVVLFEALSRVPHRLVHVCWVLRAALLVQVVVLLLGMGRWDSPTRYMGTFNDPNQFGVYVLFAFFYIKIIDAKTGRRGWLLDDALCIMLITASASTGMVLGLCVYYACITVRAILHDKRWLVLVLLLLVAVLGIAANADAIIAYLNDFSLGQRLVQKVNGFATGERNFIADRALDKVFANPQYLIFGAGDGYFDRFASVGGNEVHSTLLGIWFYFGIVAFGLLCVWIYRKLSRCFCLDSLPVLLALLAECLTLANQRQPMFWILIMLAGTDFSSVKQQDVCKPQRRVRLR